jgi:cysteine desulfurase/selenocysteine lyase
MEAIWTHEQTLTAYALGRLAEVEGVRTIGPPPAERSGVISFTVESIHPHDLAHVLDLEGVAIRAGFHCAQPLHDRFGLEATARASFYLYSGRDDVDRLLAGIRKARSILG